MWTTDQLRMTFDYPIHDSCQQDARKMQTYVDSACLMRGRAGVHESRRGAAAGGSACNRKSRNGYFSQEVCLPQARRVKGVSQQLGMKHKKCRVLWSRKSVSDSLCMEDDRMTTSINYPGPAAETVRTWYAVSLKWSGAGLSSRDSARPHRSFREQEKGSARLILI